MSREAAGAAGAGAPGPLAAGRRWWRRCSRPRRSPWRSCCLSSRHRAFPAAVARKGGCNGSRALCDRRLNEVVFPAPPTTRTPRPRSRAGSSPISATESSAELRDGIRGVPDRRHYGGARPRLGPGADRPRLRGLVAEQGRPAVEPAGASDRRPARRAGGPGAGEGQGGASTSVTPSASSGAEPLDEQLELFRRPRRSNPR